MVVTIIFGVILGSALLFALLIGPQLRGRSTSPQAAAPPPDNAIPVTSLVGNGADSATNSTVPAL